MNSWNKATASQPIQPTEYKLLPLKEKATLDLFGNQSITIDYYSYMRIPNCWIRFWTKVFFNSKWTLNEQTN